MKPLFKTKRMCIATLLALVMVVAVGATLALMASSPQFLTNTFAAADVDTEVDESIGEPDVKTVWIENNGKSPVYVRARIMVSGVAENQIVTCTQALYDQYEATGELNNNAIYLIMNNEDVWQQSGDSTNAADSYYYYLGVLQPDEATEELMTKVIIPNEAFKEELKAMGDKFNITIYHESVLAIGDKPGTELGDVVNAFNTADGNTTSSTTP